MLREARGLSVRSCRTEAIGESMLVTQDVAQLLAEKVSILTKAAKPSLSREDAMRVSGPIAFPFKGYMKYDTALCRDCEADRWCCARQIDELDELMPDMARMVPSFVTDAKRNDFLADEDFAEHDGQTVSSELVRTTGLAATY